MFRRLLKKKQFKKILFSSTLITSNETKNNIETTKTIEKVEQKEDEIIQLRNQEKEKAYERYFTNLITEFLILLGKGLLVYYFVGYFYFSIPTSLLTNVSKKTLAQKKIYEIKKKEETFLSLFLNNYLAVFAGINYALILDFTFDWSIEKYVKYEKFNKIVAQITFCDSLFHILSVKLFKKN